MEAKGFKGGWGSAITAILILAWAFAAAFPASAADRDDTSTSQAVVSALGARIALDLDTTRLDKWNDALARHAATAADASACHYAHPAFCFQAYWAGLVDELRGLDSDQQLSRINHEINKIAYASDPSLWGKRDYWASPQEVFERGAGDCEDLAIFKYLLLRAVGIPAERMSLTVVANATHAHMVLVVDRAGGPVVLDNLTDEIRLASDPRADVPLYVLSEAGWQMVVPVKKS